MSEQRHGASARLTAILCCAVVCSVPACSNHITKHDAGALAAEAEDGDEEGCGSGDEEQERKGQCNRDGLRSAEKDE